MADELIQISCEGYEDDFDDDFDSDEDEDFDCGQYVHDGTVYCQNAGSEMCEWDCPYRDEIGEDIDDEEDEQIDARASVTNSHEENTKKENA